HVGLSRERSESRRCGCGALILIDVVRYRVVVREHVGGRLAGRRKIAHERYLHAAAIERARLERHLASAVRFAHGRDLPLPIEDDMGVVLAFAAAVLVPEFERHDAAALDLELAALDHGIRARELE